MPQQTVGNSRARPKAPSWIVTQSFVGHWPKADIRGKADIPRGRLNRVPEWFGANGRTGTWRRECYCKQNSLLVVPSNPAHLGVKRRTQSATWPTRQIVRFRGQSGHDLLRRKCLLVTQRISVLRPFVSVYTGSVAKVRLTITSTQAWPIDAQLLSPDSFSWLLLA